MRISDFRSDTVTRPTPEMYQAMAEAPLGDDVLGDDPSVIKLEEYAADLLSKEAALFVPSGVMANQIAIHYHTQPGDELICEAGSHTYNNETGAIAALSSVQVRPLVSERGTPRLEDVRAAIQDGNVHHPRSSLIVLENTHNASGGRILPQADVFALQDLCSKHGLAFHLDGARLANAAVAQDKSMAELAAPFDTLSLCLSKGLGAPVGSLVFGSKAFVQEARRTRKMFGGGMRQAGVLAACGIVSLEKMVNRLAEDHRLAFELAQGLSQIEGIELDLSSVETNMVYFKLKAYEELQAEELRQALAKKGVLALYLNPQTWRMVSHYDVGKEDVQRALTAWEEILKERL